MSIPVTREYTTGAGYTSRLALAQLRASFRGWALVPFVLVLVLMIGFAIYAISQQQVGALSSLLIYPAILMVLLAVVFFVTKQQADRITPTGSPYSATMNDDSVRIRIGSITTEVPYGTYSKVARSGEFVILRFRTTRANLILPAALFPDEDFDTLVAAVTDPDAATAVTALADGLGTGLDHEYITDARYAPRLARSALSKAFLRGPMIVILVIVTGLGLLMLLGGFLGLLLAGTGRVPLSEVGPMFGSAAFFLGFSALVIFGSYLLIRMQLRKVIPVGSVYGIAFGERTLIMRGPVNSAELPYTSYKRARRRGSFVELVGTRGNGRVTLPGELFPGTELERLNRLLGAG